MVWIFVNLDLVLLSSMNFADNIDSITAHIRTNKSPIAKERWSSKACEIGDLVLRLQSEFSFL